MTLLHKITLIRHDLILWGACLTAIGTGADVGFSQDRTLVFGTRDAGQDKAIRTFGLDTAWLNEANVRRGAIFMGADQLDLIRFSFTGDWALVDGDLSTNALAEFDERMAIVNTYARSDTALYLNNDTGTYDPSFIGTDGRVEPVEWAKLINATRQRLVNAGRTILSVTPYNEPDNSFEQGSISRLGDVIWQLRNTYGTEFSGIRMYGGSTLNPDLASDWYDTLNGYNFLEEGCTHQLSGTFDSYANFYQSVKANGDQGINDEVHNVMEAMVGAEYGMDSVIWWGTAELARGEFAKASMGCVWAMQNTAPIGPQLRFTALPAERYRPSSARRKGRPPRQATASCPRTGTFTLTGTAHNEPSRSRFQGAMGTRSTSPTPRSS